MNVCVLSRQSGRVPRALSSTSHLVPAARSALQPDLTHRALSSRYYNRYLGINIGFTLLDLLPRLTVLFFSSRTKEKGRREDRGESGLSSSWLPFITVRISLLTHSHAHIHTHRVRRLILPLTCWQNTYMNPVKCTESPLTAGWLLKTGPFEAL